MKKLFTLMAIVLMLVLAVSLFAACDNKQETTDDLPSDDQVLNFEDIVSDKMSDTDVANFLSACDSISNYRYNYNDGERMLVVENSGSVAKQTSAEETVYYSKEDGKYYRYDSSSYGKWSKSEVAAYDTQLYAYQMYVEVLFETADFASMEWSDSEKGYVYRDGEGSIVLKFKDGKLVGARSVYSQDVVLVFYDFDKVNSIILPFVEEDNTGDTTEGFGSKMPLQTPTEKIDSDMSAIRMLTAGISNYYGVNFVATSITTSTEDLEVSGANLGTQFAVYKTIRNGSVSGGEYNLFSTVMSGTAGNRQLVNIFEETYIEKSASGYDIRFRDADADNLFVDDTVLNVTLKDGADFNPVEYYGSLTTYKNLFAENPELIWLYDLTEGTVIASACTAPVYDDTARTYSFTIVADPDLAAIGFRERVLKVLKGSSVSNEVKDLNIESLSFDVEMWENGYIKSVAVTSKYSVSVKIGNMYLPTTVTCSDEMYFSYYDGEEGFSSEDIEASKFGSDNEANDNIMELLMLFDDVIKSLSDIDNVGNLGADSYIEFVIEKEDVAKKIRVDLDVSIDALAAYNGGNGYINNGIGFTVSADGGDGTFHRLFGIWYVDELTDEDSYIYLSAGGQNVKIDGFSLAAVLEKYNLNADIEVGSVLAGIGSLTENPDLIGYVTLLRDLGIDLEYEKVGNDKVFRLNIKELFNPSEDNVLGLSLNEILFNNEDITDLLSSLGIAITSIGDVYNILPDVDLEITGSYDADNKYESISVGLNFGSKADGVTIPTTDGNGICVVESLPDTKIFTTIGFDILYGEDAWVNVANSIPADADRWNEIGAFNYYFEGQIVLGKTKETASVYDVLISADIDVAAISMATFVRKMYFVDEYGNYYINPDGTIASKDVLYLRNTGFFDGNEKDLFDYLLPAINSLYIKMVNVQDPSKILFLNLDEKITVNYAGEINGGTLTVKTSALLDILQVFFEISPEISSTIESIEGSGVEVAGIYDTLKNLIASQIYTSDINGYSATAIAPQYYEAESLSIAEVATGGFDVLKFINNLLNCMIVDSYKGEVRFVGSGAEYNINDTVLDFDITYHKIMESEFVDGCKINIDKFIVDYVKGGIVNSYQGTVQVGGGEIFNAILSINKRTSSENKDLYIGVTVNKIGYGCAVRNPVSVDDNYDPTSSLNTDGGWMIVK